MLLNRNKRIGNDLFVFISFHCPQLFTALAALVRHPWLTLPEG